ncbi:MAG: ABC transporter substrate-binding protein [Salegentibacter sp.]|uniref:ABC transporter substrate-binding protein n=1 Tax=Salegentibacter sp. TaxID=1903072 RepID=UPI00287013F7|nr:ABC transporter substrate-binding protein [Salegentibacter sp.]MDR9456115.1 ABC transporter substrate-binding protein [Salegentibacter sp.]
MPKINIYVCEALKFLNNLTFEVKSVILKYLISLFSLLLLFSCKSEEKNASTIRISEGNPVEIKYAKGFSIEEFNGYSIVKVNNPWPGSDLDLTYLLVEENAKIPEDLRYDQKVQIPVEEVVVTSTTHIPALEALKVESKLTGFPGLDYISSEKTRELINSGKIKELGKNENINTEVLIDLQPDVVIGFAIDGNNKTFENIQKTGIPVVFNADWVEENPLGKAEWIKFMAAFFGKTAQASTIFDQIENDYLEAKELAETAENQPDIISGSMYKDQWYMPYGNSWQARFFEEANANYLYKETEGSGSLSLSFENVLEKAQNADFWISSGEVNSYSQLLNESRHYSQFKAVREKKVFSVSLEKGETGGVLYFELGPQRPDLILKDLISIFHPDLLPDYEQVFFKALKD